MPQGPYHIIPIGILLVLTYLASLLAIRMQLLDQSRHKRFWNVILLLFFLSAALLGLFLSVKVNYKLNIPWIDPLMQWHVDLGIGLAFVAVFHFTWHLGYYRRALVRIPAKRKEDSMAPHLDYNSLQVTVLFSLLGFMTIITQLVLLREYIKTLHGNELVIGLFLAIWMVLTAAGARAGTIYKARISGPTLLKSMLLLSCYPVAIFLLLILITRLILLPGFVPGILSSISHMVLIIPFTLVSGFLFAYLSRALQSKKVDATFYMLDSLGSLAGGILFGLVLVFFLNNIQVIALLFLVTSVVLALFFRVPGTLSARITVILSGVLVFALVLVPAVRNGLEGLRFKGETILETKDTPQGNLCFTDRDGLVTGYLDRNPVVSSYEPAICEEQIHYAALQRPDPSSFLLIGGGLSGIETEVMKYHPGTFDYCEANRWMYNMGLRHMPSSGYHHFIDMDIRNWLARSDPVRYDVIISNVGEPLTLGWNRYFTAEFFGLVKSRLSAEGVFSVQLPAAGNYIHEVGSEQLVITYQTLKEVFRHVIIVPGYATYFLASEQPLSLDFPQLLKGKAIETIYVHSDYLDASRLTFENNLLMERIGENLQTQKKQRINSDLWPVLFFQSISAWNLKTDGNRLIYIGLMSLLVFILLLISYPRRKAGMFVAGFTGAGMQILLIMVMQSFYGFAYLVTPLMITLFMGGLVTGTLVWKKFWRGPSLSKTTGLMWIMALLGAAAVILLKTEQFFTVQWTGMVILGVLNFLPGVIVGSVYGILLALTRTEAKTDMGWLYSADLTGAAFGSLLPPLFLVPLIGVSNTFILFCGINVAAGLYIQTGKGKK
jgi:spermidine synthase